LGDGSHDFDLFRALKMFDGSFGGKFRERHQHPAPAAHPILPFLFRMTAMLQVDVYSGS
jgi:hypothetical protein